MTVTAYSAVQPASVGLANNTPTLVLQLRLPNTGYFVVFGRVVVSNLAPGVQPIQATMTTLDGTTILDFASVDLPGLSGGNGAVMVLNAILNLNASNQNEIVDIRCSGTNGAAQYCSLIAIPVDAISGSV